MIGDKFGALTVLKYEGKDNHSHNLWLCGCECGGSKIATTCDLKTGRVKSCGCLRKRVNNCVCLVCGKEFYAAPNVIKKGGGKYCSKKCMGISKRNGVIKTCAVCERRFYVKEYIADQTLYCCRECADIGRTKERTVKVCIYCGKIFFTRNQTQMFCSRECHFKDHTGCGSPVWKGGISYKPYCEKFNHKKKEEIRNKYRRKCFICGKDEKENGRRLDVHHVDYDKDQGCNGKQWILVPLCQSCHGKTNHDREFWESIIVEKIEYGKEIRD